MPGFPWALVLKQGPQLMTSAVNLLTVSRGRAAEPATARDLQALVVRVAEVVKDQRPRGRTRPRLGPVLLCSLELADSPWDWWPASWS